MCLVGVAVEEAAQEVEQEEDEEEKSPEDGAVAEAETGDKRQQNGSLKTFMLMI